ncbi:hypothetical protein N0V93_004001 [Gnomoniopsis smithogilvyi]|uniref:Peptidase A1 domain-containing protein n=1 Tax=Gnomoniopsis smithogilvyi TaxID=1191159 RepID=A0A9W9CZN8_9PEZI|nr:hypothetical protein N0V93_004001 [Gnomoniopsis smithogilvyi]
MQTFGAYFVAVLAASAELASALPQKMDLVEPRGQEQGRTLSVPVVHNMNRRKALGHPALAYAKALRKFNATIPTHVQAVVDRFRLPSAKRADEEGSVVATSVDSDTEYVATISVGTPAQSLPMDFDTGSADLWVMGSGVSGTSGHTTYDSSSSSTATKMSSASWSISYGDGSSSSGDVYTDTVTIGNLTFAKQAVEVATTVSSEFTEDTDISGLVGLAQSSINTVTPTAQNTWFDNIKSSLASPLFTADLKHDTKGSYNFGYIDAAAHTGTIYYADLVTSGEFGGFWTFVASGYTVGTSTSSSSGSSSSSSAGSATTAASSSPTGAGSSSTGGGSSSTGSGSSSTGGESGGFGGFGGFGGDSSSDSGSTLRLRPRPRPRLFANAWGFKEKKSNGMPTRTTPEKRTVTRRATAITGIADTGTTLLMLPDTVVSDYYAQVSGAQDSTEEGGYVFSCDATLPDFSFNVGEGEITIPGDYINFQPISTGSSTCYGGIQSDSGIGMAIFGDIALKAALVVFDSGNSRLGWAAKDTSS